MHAVQALDPEWQVAWTSDDGVNWQYEVAQAKSNKELITTSTAALYIAYARAELTPFNPSDPIKGTGIGKLSVYYLDHIENDIILTFPSDQGFDCFRNGDVVQGDDVSIINIDADNNQITVNGGDWTGTDGTNSGSAPQDDKLVSTAPRLTVASLATPNFVDNESIRMVSAAGETSSYVPVTNTITNVEQDPNGELTVTTFAASSNQSVLATLPTPFGADGNFLPTSAIDKNLYFNNNSETEGGGPNIWAWSGAPIGTELHMHFTQIGSGFRITDVVGSITEIKYFDPLGR